MIDWTTVLPASKKGCAARREVSNHPETALSNMFCG